MDFKDLSDWLRKLRDLSQKYPVLVEGKNDLRTLRRYGIRNIITLSGKRFSEIPDILERAYEGAILLFDLDPHGERINEKMKKLLRSQGFLVIEDFREYLKGAGIIHIEGLRGYEKAEDTEKGSRLRQDTEVQHRSSHGDKIGDQG